MNGSARRLQRIIYITLVVVISLTIAVQRSDVAELTGMAWDSGAVTTGCVTVPLVLAGDSFAELHTTRKKCMLQHPHQHVANGTHRRRVSHGAVVGGTF